MNKDLNHPIFNSKQERFVKEYFIQLDHRLGVTKDTPEHLVQQFSNKLTQFSQKRSGLVLGWKSGLAAILSAFSVGILFSQVALVPATMATRGYSAESSEAVINPPRILSFKVDSPKDYAFRLANTSLDADVETTLTRSGNKVEMVIHSLKANEVEQAQLKRMLNLSNEASGDYTVVIGPHL